VKLYVLKGTDYDGEQIFAICDTRELVEKYYTKYQEDIHDYWSGAYIVVYELNEYLDEWIEHYQLGVRK
jgi:hypothetical protein